MITPEKPLVSARTDTVRQSSSLGRPLRTRRPAPFKRWAGGSRKNLPVTTRLIRNTASTTTMTMTNRTLLEIPTASRYNRVIHIVSPSLLHRNKDAAASAMRSLCFVRPKEARYVSLQLPNRLAGDDGANGTPFQFPAVKWSVARSRKRILFAERPFQFGIDDCNVRVYTGAERSFR